MWRDDVEIVLRAFAACLSEPPDVAPLSAVLDRDSLLTSNYEHYEPVTNAEDYNSNTYTSGPSSPFGYFKATNEQMSLYATYASIPI